MSPTITTVLSDSDGQEGGSVTFGNTEFLKRFSDFKNTEDKLPDFLKRKVLQFCFEIYHLHFGCLISLFVV